MIDMKRFIKSVCFLVVFLSCSLPVFAEDISVSEQVIIDDHGIKVTVTDYEYGGFGMEQAEFHVVVENNTEKDLKIRAQGVSINGYMVDPYWHEDVKAHNSRNSSIDFYAFELEDLGIDRIVEVEMAFAAYSGDSQEPDFVTVPGIIKTSAFGVYEQSYDDSGEVLIDDQNIKVVAKELSTNEYGISQYLYIENNTEKEIHLCATENAVNGKILDGVELNFPNIYPGKKAREALGYMNSDLNKAEIKSAESVGANLTFTDAETGELLLSQRVTIGGDTLGILYAPPTETGIAYTDDFVEISVGNINVDNIGNTTLPISIKNVSGTTLTYSFGGLRVNGVDISGYSGKTLDADYLKKIEAYETYETTIGIRRDSLRDNSITSIERLEVDMTFMTYTAVIHDITLDVPFSKDSVVDTSLVSLSKDSNDYAYKMFHFIGGDRLYILYELTNPNDVTVHLKGTIQFKDENGKILDTDTDEVQYINSERYNFMIFSSEKTDASNLTLSVEPSQCKDSEKAKFAYDLEELEGGGIKISVTNEEAVDAVVQMTVLLTKNGSIVGFRRGFGNGIYETVPAGSTAIKEISDIDFDDQTVYITSLKK